MAQVRISESPGADAVASDIAIITLWTKDIFEGLKWVFHSCCVVSGDFSCISDASIFVHIPVSPQAGNKKRARFYDSLRSSEEWNSCIARDMKRDEGVLQRFQTHSVSPSSQSKRKKSRVMLAWDRVQSTEEWRKDVVFSIPRGQKLGGASVQTSPFFLTPTSPSLKANLGDGESSLPFSYK